MNRPSLGLILVASVTTVGCKDSELVKNPCVPGDLECLDDPDHRRIRVCNEWGSAWVESTCPDDRICRPGACEAGDSCPDTCVPLICEPGERFCGGNNIYLYQCNALGTAGCYAQSCASPPLDGVCFAGQCVSVCGAGQKSYLGCEYFAADLDNADVDCNGSPGGLWCDAANQQFSVVASNPDPQHLATVIVTSGELLNPPQPSECKAPGELDPPENFVAAKVLPPKGIEVFKLPRRNINGTVLDKLAYRVASNIPITVYQFNPLENVEVFSNDASLLMPSTAADKEYFAMNRAQFNPKLLGFVTVVGIAAEPTTVTVKPTANIMPGIGILPISAGTTRQFTLERFEVLNLEPFFGRGADLTGTHIEADQPVIVYAGNEAANSPSSTCEGGLCTHDPDLACQADVDCGIEIECCADHLEQQLIPVSAWGREYVGVRSYQRGEEPDAWRVLAARDETHVTITPPPESGSVPPVLAAGQWFEVLAQGNVLISADKPILVGQFLVGANYKNAGIGDPAFMLAVPIRQFRDSYVFLAPGTSDPNSIGYAEDYVSIAFKTGGEARLDGQELYDYATQSPWYVDIEPLEGSDWSAFRGPVSDGFHNLVCPETCGVMVHGYDQYVSYGYPGGMNLLECQSNADCEAPRRICSAAFACVECQNDDDCPAEKPHCHELDFVCQV